MGSSKQLHSWTKAIYWFCYVVFNSHMCNATEVQLLKWCIHKCFLLFHEANTCVALPNSWRRSVRALSLCYYYSNRSQSTVDKTVELRWVVYHVAEPVYCIYSKYDRLYPALWSMGVSGAKHPLLDGWTPHQKWIPIESTSFQKSGVSSISA
jgi:hypothetical protein